MPFTGRLSRDSAFSRRISSSASSRSWCASAGLAVVTDTVLPRTSMLSQASARASPRIVRKASRSRYSARRLARCCFASTRGRTLPSLSTAFHHSVLDAPDHRAADDTLREGVRRDRGDDDLAGVAELLQQRRPAAPAPPPQHGAP